MEFLKISSSKALLPVKSAFVTAFSESQEKSFAGVEAVDEIVDGDCDVVCVTTGCLAGVNYTTYNETAEQEGTWGRGGWMFCCYG